MKDLRNDLYNNNNAMQWSIIAKFSLKQDEQAIDKNLFLP